MLNLLSNTLAFLFAIGVVIFVHELGHLLAAKFFRIHAHTFSLGFGRRIWGFERGGTEYRVSLFPLGGYVQLSGENPEEVGDDPYEFLNRPRWQRILVYVAGPAMNIALAVGLVAVVFMVGIEVAAPPDIAPIVGSVRADSPAEEAGLVSGDRILAIDGQEVERWEDVQFAFVTSPARALALTVRRGERQFETSLTPNKVPRYEFGDAGAFPKVLPRVTALVAGEPAEAAGFRPGDLVRAVDGRAVGDTQEFIELVSAAAGRELEIEVLRGDEPRQLRVTPRDNDGRGWIGVSLSLTAFQRFGPLRALTESLRFNWGITVQTFAVLGKIVSGQLAAKSALSGPIQIAALSGAAARSGFENLLHFMGLISISIAILNLLPIPVLDGGQIALLLLESVARRDLSLRVKERINQVGFVVIVMIMIMVLYFDLVKTIPVGLLPGS